MSKNFDWMCSENEQGREKGYFTSDLFLLLKRVLELLILNQISSFTSFNGIYSNYGVVLPIILHISSFENLSIHFFFV